MSMNKKWFPHKIKKKMGTLLNDKIFLLSHYLKKLYAKIILLGIKLYLLKGILKLIE